MSKTKRARPAPVVMAAFAAACALLAASQADACPGAGECLVEGGGYRIALPPKGGERGALVFFHGFQGSSAETMANEDLANAARELGIALIAPQGLEGRWSFPGIGVPKRDELAYVERVAADAVSRFGLDPDRLMASGFSLGGSMVWYLACAMPTRFAAFAPVAGAFWEPLPASCVGQRPKIVHVHGVNDATVPIAGRQLRSGMRQGDLYKSLARMAPACGERLGAPVIEGALSCRIAACEGSRLEVCLHAGAHDLDAAWVTRAWRLAFPAQR